MCSNEQSFFSQTQRPLMSTDVKNRQQKFYFLLFNFAQPYPRIITASPFGILTVRPASIGISHVS